MNAWSSAPGVEPNTKCMQERCEYHKSQVTVCYSWDWGAISTAPEPLSAYLLLVAFTPPPLSPFTISDDVGIKNHATVSQRERERLNPRFANWKVKTGSAACWHSPGRRHTHFQGKSESRDRGTVNAEGVMITWRSVNCCSLDVWYFWVSA